MKDKEVVVLLSGGIDSTTLLADAVERAGADKVLALTLFYGQRHDKELASARAVAGYYSVDHMVQDLSDVFKMSDSPLLAASEGEIPEGTYDEAVTREADGMSKTYVPYRNGLFLSYAAAIAYSVGASEIVYGAHADDAAGNAYPDCTQEFYRAQSHAVVRGTGGKVHMTAPLIGMNKADVVGWGLELDAPYHLTWSCYKGKGKACGKCGTCRDRLAAFKVHQAVDPIDYD